jgi:transcriptional regulator GlxA family with amidase domain
VAKMVKYFLDSPVPKSNAYNLACDETPTLEEFYILIVIVVLTLGVSLEKRCEILRRSERERYSLLSLCRIWGD